VASRRGFAPPAPAELAGGAATTAGPPAPAVTSDRTRHDTPAVGLSLAAARALAGRLLGPAAATATWTPTGSDQATAVIGGRRFVVADQTDPYGCFDTLTVSELVACPVCGDQHSTPVPAPAARSATSLPGQPTQCSRRGSARGRQPVPAADGRAPAPPTPTTTKGGASMAGPNPQVLTGRQPAAPGSGPDRDGQQGRAVALQPAVQGWAVTRRSPRTHPPDPPEPAA